MSRVEVLKKSVENASDYPNWPQRQTASPNRGASTAAKLLGAADDLQMLGEECG
jgi:hypothetical protein